MLAKIFTVLLLACSSSVFAAAKKTYQVTGMVTELTEKDVTVEKGKEKFVISREAATKVNGGDLKKGSKVTVYYSMSADEIEVKK